MNKQFPSICIFFWLLTVVWCCSSPKESAKKQSNSTATQNTTNRLNKIVGTARIEPETKIVKLSSEVSGVVKAVYVKTGEKVKKGQVLIELNSDIEVAQLNDTRAALAYTQSDKSNLQASIEATRIKAENARKRLERLQYALSKNAETAQNVDNVKAEYEGYLKEIERIEAQMQSNGLLSNQNRQKVELSEAQLNRRQIKAPSDGLILSIDLSPGAAVNALASIAEFAPESAMNAITEVDENFATDVQIGQKAYVRLVGKTDTLATGEVISAAPYLKKKSLFSDEGSDMEDRRVREVKVRLESSDKLLHGMRVETVILLSK